jgi:hypothetical protein
MPTSDHIQVTPEQSKGIKLLDRRIRQVMRSGQRLSGKQKLAPEAEVALQDLSAIRHDLAGGRHLRFAIGSERTINTWDYEGLAEGVLPDEVQVGFVVGDLMQLARVPEHDSLAEDVLTTLVNEVYRNEVPRNRPGLPNHHAFRIS